MLRSALAALFGVLVLACNGGSTASPSPSPGTATPGAGGDGDQVATVTVQNIAFETDSIAIEPGTEVRWVNEDAVGHTVTHGEQGAPADNPVIDEPHPVGATVSHVFEQSGEYPITCTIHPQMNMTVSVEP